MDLLELSDEVLTCIAEQLPPNLRLRKFSLVHSRFRAAALHATSLSHTFGVYREVPRRKGQEDFWDWDEDDRPTPPELFAKWLPNHGQHLTKLCLTNFNKTFYGLPPGLKELELHGCGAGWHEPEERGVPHTFGWHAPDREMLRELTSLTKLHMGMCSYTYNTIRQVAAATNLRHLTFSCPDPEQEDCYIGVFSSHMDCTSLEQLTNLTHLELRTVSPKTGRTLLVTADEYCPRSRQFSDFSNVVQHLSCLVKLQTLIIHPGWLSPGLAAALAGLHNMTELTRLELVLSSYSPAIGHHPYGKAWWLPGLTSLQSLHLERFMLEPSQLHGLTKLAYLHLVDVRFSPSHLLELLGKLTMLQQLHIQCDDRPAPCAPLPSPAFEGAPDPVGAGFQGMPGPGLALLQGMPGLGYALLQAMATAAPRGAGFQGLPGPNGAGLQGAPAGPGLAGLNGPPQLGLAGLEGTEELVWPPPSAEYAGLTASSQLQEITLVNCRLPSGIWQHVFPAGRQLKQLRSLYASAKQVPVAKGSDSPCGDEGEHCCCCCVRQAAQPVPVTLSFAGTDLACIAAACPNLKQLCMR